MRLLQRIALTLAVIGALNWGLIGFFDFNLVAAIFGQDTFWSNLIYALVGLSGVVCLTILFKSWDDVSETDGEVRRQGHGKLNYGTEFSDEVGSVERKDVDRDYL